METLSPFYDLALEVKQRDFCFVVVFQPLSHA